MEAVQKGRVKSTFIIKLALQSLGVASPANINDWIHQLAESA